MNNVTKPLVFDVQVKDQSYPFRIELRSNIIITLRSLSLISGNYNVCYTETADGDNASPSTTWTLLSTDQVVASGNPVTSVTIDKSLLKTWIRFRVEEYDSGSNLVNCYDGVRINVTQETTQTVGLLDYQIPGIDVVNEISNPVYTRVEFTFGDDVVVAGGTPKDLLFILDDSGNVSVTDEVTENAWIAAGNLAHTKVLVKKISFYNKAGNVTFVVVNKNITDAAALVASGFASKILAGGGLNLSAEYDGYYSVYFSSALGCTIEYATN